MGNSVETRVDSALSAKDGANAGLSVRMLGPLTLLRDGSAVELPASRKARALFAYLTLARGPVGRSRLCDLLWDAPNDPRGELRWCLSKLRYLFDKPSRIRTADDRVALDLEACFVDAVEVASAVETGPATLDIDRLRSLSTLFIGDFLDGLNIDRAPSFAAWLVAQRRRFSACHVAILEQLSLKLPRDCEEASFFAEKWVEIAPFEQRAHLTLLTAMARQGKLAECEDHLATATRLFESEGLDFAPVRAAWRLARGRAPGQTRYAEPAATAPTEPEPHPAEAAFSRPSRASLAVMPFVEEATEGSLEGGLADGLTHDIITRLAKLRDLFVIARGSVFALAEKNIGPEEAGRRLNVDYVTSGGVQRKEGRIEVSVELVEVRTARIVWADMLHHKLDDTFDVLNEIGDNIVSSLVNEIELAERNRAILKAPNSLSAWEAYHRGLWHMYRFTQSENELAQHYFTKAVKLDPTFARAHAGLSFTHWQKAFQRWADREVESDRAFETAGRSLLVNEHNPAAHWAMGRALWLRAQQDESLRELGKAVDLSPSFALGHYFLSFVHSQSGDPALAIKASDHSRSLSPFDPLLFGMLATRAVALVRLGEFDEAAEWSVKAAARPNAHPLILAIAAHCLPLAGRLEEARAVAASIGRTLPGYRTDDFLDAYRFAPDATALFRRAGKRIGLD